MVIYFCTRAADVAPRDSSEASPRRLRAPNRNVRRGPSDRVENPHRSRPTGGTLVEPLALFGIQYTLSLVAYGLIGSRRAAPRCRSLPRERRRVPRLPA